MNKTIKVLLAVGAAAVFAFGANAEAEKALDRGIAYATFGDYNKALADYTQAITLDPNYADAYLWRGVAYGELGDHDKALADYSQAIKLDPNSAAAYGFRGAAYMTIEDYKSATKDARKMCELGVCVLLQRIEENNHLHD
ncbi:MAG: tetratricopeptide repeat protein [Helicobacteraceae bacterium]|jgi:tetratricopeptide (TPR) repeat protein|nr:tetratricopeptide repeat protein [Helicobacteraceae bacterium]